MPDRSCSSGKIRYASKSSARKALSRHRGSMATMRCYVCPECHGFHLGHRDPRGQYAFKP